MARVFLMILDSFGIGNAPDAESYGDKGSDTLGHIAAWRAKAGRPLHVPNLNRLGLGAAGEAATGIRAPGLEGGATSGAYAVARETSRGKDTPSGHWEIAGVPVTFDWGYFPHTVPTFPRELTDAIVAEAKLPGFLGNCHASGTTIIAELGEESIRSGKPIFYTSADSVLQIAAHEDHFGLDRLYELCEISRRLLEPYNIGRVIARPFIGESAATFERTGNRHDYAIPPPEPTVLARIEQAGGRVLAIGKIGDIFAHTNITEVRKATGIEALYDTTLQAMKEARDGDIVFTNFVDFDSSFGHRRDVDGYAGALEQFDRRLPELEALLQPRDLLLFTADHGCDPTWPGTDHTRESVPVLMAGPTLAPGFKGIRSSFADIGETIAHWMGLPKGPHGETML